MATSCHPPPRRLAAPPTPARRLAQYNGQALPAMARRAAVLPWAGQRFAGSGGAHSQGRVRPSGRSAVASQPLEVGLPPPVAAQEHELSVLLARLGQAASYVEKLEMLRSLPAVEVFLSGSREGRLVEQELGQLPPKHAFCLAALPAMHQAHVLSLIPTSIPISNALAQLAVALSRVEDFYDSIGGLLGYQRQCLALIAAHDTGACAEDSASSSGRESGSWTDSADWPLDGEGQRPTHPTTEFLVPPGLDLASPEQATAAAEAVAAGIDALPRMAEIYPLGGAGDRLGLRCDVSGESLPTAVLQYCGRSLLENLVRDLQAREHLHWKLRGRQVTTPVAIMTSAAKGNHWRVAQLFEELAWFGRGEASFRLFQQPLVPVVSTRDGRWLLDQPLKPLMKPGGHGVIWKLMIDAGVFDWLAAHGREAAVVRQISNPMAGTDNTLLALTGAGFSGRRSFGFASCERVVGAAEGMNVLACRVAAGQQGATPRYSYRITNVEYTEFERLGVEDSSVDEASNFSVFPANTNVLYVGLQAAERAVRASMAAGTTDAVLPGMILNGGKRLTWADPLAGGAQRSVHAGRLECTMQNLADSLAQHFDAPLHPAQQRAVLGTFLVYNQRRKVTSSAKRKLKPGSTAVHQTPDGSFLDLQRNAEQLLADHCGWEVPQVGSVDEYLACGPGFVFLAHPALGPLWQVIGQKLRGGSLAPRSELQLEAAEVCVRNLHVDGSLRVLADAPLGHLETRPVRRADGAAAAPAHRSGSLDALMHPVKPAAGNNGGATLGGLGSTARLVAVGSGGADGYSQPCTFPAAECDPGAQEPRLVFSDRCGRLRLHSVHVRNAGVHWDHPGNVWWRHSLERRESCRILLHGAAEFEARDVTLSGDLVFEVPDGHRMLVLPGPDGQPLVQLEPIQGPTWRWRYSMEPGGEVELELEELGGGGAGRPAAGSGASSTSGAT